MASQEEQYIREIEETYNADQQAGLDKIHEFLSRSDALDLVPKIFEVSTNPIMQFAGAEILKKHIKDNWTALSDDDKSEIRSFLLNTVSSCEDSRTRTQLNSIIAQIAIRTYPDEWPDFLVSSVENGEYEQFQFFLEEMKSSPPSILSSERKTAITNELVAQSANFLQILVNNYQTSDLALNRYVYYIKWDDVNQVDFDGLFSDDPLVFGPLCSILQIDGAPDELIHISFETLSLLAIDNEDTFKRIVPVLQKHIYSLENEQCIQYVTNIHTKLLDIDFLDLLYYWEPFVVTIYSQIQKEGELTRRFHLHYPILVKIREYVIYHMIQPPDFIIPEVISLDNDQAQRENYNEMRSILISFIGMTPKEVNESFLAAIQYLKSNYTQENFLSFVWTLSSISGATQSHLESAFVVESMKFIIDIFRLPDIEKSVVASSFLFLASAYARAQKLTVEFISSTINLAIQALDSHKTQKIAANTLLTIAKKSTSLIEKVPNGLIEIIGGGTIPPDIFCQVTEACGRIYQAKTKKIDTVTEVLINRFSQVASEEDVNFEIVQEHIIIINGFVGLSRVDSASIEKVVTKYRDVFTQITQNFGSQILQIYEENGSDSSGREDVRQMRSYIQVETSLFKELIFQDCGDIFNLYASLPIELRFPEALQLCEALFKSNLDETVVSGLRDTVVQPTEEMLSENPAEFPDMEELFPRVLNAMATSYFEAFNSGDIEFLIGRLRNDIDFSQLTVLAVIRALDTCVYKADMKLIDQPRVEFFTSFLLEIVYRLLLAITDSCHSFCYSQILRLLFKLFDFVATGKVRCDLFAEEEEENVHGMILHLSEMTVKDFPLLTMQEMTQLIQQFFQENLQMETFEELIAQYIARTRQTTQSETLDSLRLQQFKNSMSDFYYY